MSALQTLEAPERLLASWGQSLKQFDLGLVAGHPGPRSSAIRKSAHRLFHIVDWNGGVLLLIQISAVLEGAESKRCLIQYLQPRRLNREHEARSSLAALQFENLLLASGARSVERRMKARALFRCTPAVLAMIPKVLPTLKRITMQFVFREVGDVLQPVAASRGTSSAMYLLAGNLIEPLDGLSCYASLTPERMLLGRSRADARASETLQLLASSFGPDQARIIPFKEMSAPVSPAPR
jgi:hypothetical protein